MPSRCFFGMRSWIVEATGGQAVVQTELMCLRPIDKDKRVAKDRNGVMVLQKGSPAIYYSHWNLGRLNNGPT